MTFDLDALVEARTTTFGVGTAPIDPLVFEGLQVFATDALAAAARNRISTSTALDWIDASVSCQVWLEHRLRQTPTLSQTILPGPVFVISAGRTGSTLLQRLLALEPSFRSPQLWELWHPFPPADAKERAVSLRESEDLLKKWPPLALRLHPMGSQEPDECHWIMRHNPVRATMHLTWDYWEWLQALDKHALERLFTVYRQQVQVLQTSEPDRRWLSKSFAHMHYWPVLFDVFPDAYVVSIHRDPRETLASACNLIHQLVRGGDPLAIGEIAVAVLADGLDRMMAAAAAAPEGRVVDILYDDLCAAPSQTVFHIARRVGVPSPEALRGRVDRYLVSPKRIRAVGHTYTLEDFDLTAGGVLTRFENYIAWVRARLDPAFAGSC